MDHGTIFLLPRALPIYPLLSLARPCHAYDTHWVLTTLELPLPPTPPWLAYLSPRFQFPCLIKKKKSLLPRSPILCLIDKCLLMSVLSHCPLKSPQHLQPHIRKKSLNQKQSDLGRAACRSSGGPVAGGCGGDKCLLGQVGCQLKERHCPEHLRGEMERRSKSWESQGCSLNFFNKESRCLPMCWLSRCLAHEKQA